MYDSVPTSSSFAATNVWKITKKDWKFVAIAKKTYRQVTDFWPQLVSQKLLIRIFFKKKLYTYTIFCFTLYLLGNKGQFKDFCAQVCLKKYEHKQFGKPIDKEVMNCAVCSNEKTVEAELILGS